MKQIFLFLSVMSVLACGNSTQKSEKHITLSVSEFADRMKSEPGILLDVRTIEEYQDGFIAGAQQYDYYETASFKSALNGMDKDKTYYIYCRSGGRSGTTLDMMQQMGFKKVYNLDGGMLAWRRANQAVAKP